MWGPSEAELQGEGVWEAVHTDNMLKEFDQVSEELQQSGSEDEWEDERHSDGSDDLSGENNLFEDAESVAFTDIYSINSDKSDIEYI